jgi:hypothetical protein
LNYANGRNEFVLEGGESESVVVFWFFLFIFEKDYIIRSRSSVIDQQDNSSLKNAVLSISKNNESKIVNVESKAIV